MMYVTMAIHIWTIVVLGLTYALSLTATTELTIFKRPASSNYTAGIIGQAWLAPSLIHCIWSCLETYSTCFSVTFNLNTGSCTPRSAIVYSPGNVWGDEQFYYSNFCNKSLGFDVYLYQEAIHCLFLSPFKANFSTARSSCRDKSSRLYIISSASKLEILRYIVRNKTRSLTWVGLTDMVTEGIFIWEDGTAAVNGSFPVAWRKGNPDDAGNNEDCGEMGSSKDFTYINDQSCQDTGYFICEPW